MNAHHPSGNHVERQKKQYEDKAFLAAYEAHYNDPDSRAYRDRFIYGPMLHGIQLKGKRVLDAMCGSGSLTDHLVQAGAVVTGLDISEKAIAEYRRRWPGSTGRAASMTDSGLPDDWFDCVAIVGGLHHLHPHLDEAISEIHRILKPGSCFCFSEPHRGSLPDIFRRLWYRHDRYFADNEEGIDIQDLRRKFNSKFTFDETVYSGNLAYLLVFNSMIFRLPLAWKRFYSPALLEVEAWLRPIQNRLLSCFVIGRLQKK